MLKISVITPCFNCVEWIEGTIESVTNQEVARLEYIVVDGGSTDGTMDIIQKYADRIALIISEPDCGQYDAIHKGFSKATGDIFCWINAGDIFFAGALRTVSNIFETFPEFCWLEGQNSYISRDGMLIGVKDSAPVYPRWLLKNGFFNRWVCGFLQQENMFWRGSLYNSVEGISRNLSLAADYELWIRFANKTELYSVDVPLGAFRFMPGEQRSSVQKSEYDQQVLAVQQNIGWSFALVTRICRAISGVSLLIRIFGFGSGLRLSYDRRTMKWQVVRVVTSISKRSICSLYIEAVKFFRGK